MSKITRADIMTYIIKIQVNFENAYRVEAGTETNLLTESWFDILSNYPKEICDVAVNNALAQAKYAPRIGDIVEQIKILNSVNKKSYEELWAELKSIKYEAYNASLYLRYPQHYEDAHKKLEQIYEDLDEDLKLYLVNVSALIEFANIDEESLPFEKNRFFKNMPILRKYTEDKILAQEFLKLSNYSDIKLLGSKK